MPEIKLEHITKRWGKFYAVEDLNLVIADNAFVTLLRPVQRQRADGKDRF